jgi:hypothetical protein
MDKDNLKDVIAVVIGDGVINYYPDIKKTPECVAK